MTARALSRAQAEVVMAVYRWLQETRAETFYPTEVYPARDNIDAARRRVLRRLTERGFFQRAHGSALRPTDRFAEALGEAREVER